MFFNYDFMEDLFSQTGDFLGNYIGEIVYIETDQEKHEHLPYVGLVVDYDRYSIKLNPTRLLNARYPADLGDLAREIRESAERGEGREIILGRGVIARMNKI